MLLMTLQLTFFFGVSFWPYFRRKCMSPMLFWAFFLSQKEVIPFFVFSNHSSHQRTSKLLTHCMTQLKDKKDSEDKKGSNFFNLRRIERMSDAKKRETNETRIMTGKFNTTDTHLTFYFFNKSRNLCFVKSGTFLFYSLFLILS